MPSVTPIDEKASWTRTDAPGRRNARHRRSSEKVHTSCLPSMYRRSMSSAQPTRARPEYSSTGRTAAATPARSRLVRNFSRVGEPPNSRPSTNGSMATTSPPDARATWPSRTVERPWWLPISSSRAPEPAAVASSNNSRPWSRVSQPGTGSARAQATSKSEESAGGAAQLLASSPGRAPAPPWPRGYTHARHSTGSRGSVIATTEASVTRPARPWPGPSGGGNRGGGRCGARGRAGRPPAGRCWPRTPGWWPWRSCSAAARRRSTRSST